MIVVINTKFFFQPTKINLNFYLFEEFSFKNVVLLEYFSLIHVKLYVRAVREPVSASLFLTTPVLCE